MILATGSSSHVDEGMSSPSTSKGSKKKPSTITNSKNPYSATGLDKFSSVLADLSARKEMILATAGTQGVSMVRFIYKNSEDCVPIVVKMRDQQQQEEKSKKSSTSTNNKNPYSAMGLDKFSSVLADLSARKEMILATAGTQDVSMVRFMYRNSQDCAPKVVRIQGHQQPEEEKSMKKPSMSTNNKNPYSATGLDKFSSVLADLSARKETILATAGTQGVSMVRFMYNNSQDCVPIVVKMRDQHQHEEEEKSKNKPSTSNNNKNPYSAIGLDKFSSVLADLSARKETILATAGTHGVSMVRFMYNNSQDCVPIVVRMPDPDQDQQQQQEVKIGSSNKKSK